MTARMSAEFTLNCAFAPGATTMLFSAAASTTMTAVPLGPGRVTTPIEPDVVGVQVCTQLLGGGVAAQRGDELHRRARAGGGHRLIAALAARRRRRARTPERFGRGEADASTVNVRSALTLPTTQTRATITVNASPAPLPDTCRTRRDRFDTLG